jgi:hypothetical protein
MTILFDLSASQPIYKNDFHGGSEYAKAVFFKLCEKAAHFVDVEVFYNPLKNIDTAVLAECKKYNIIEHCCINNEEINVLLNKNLYDVFYTALPYSYQDLKIPSKTKFIYTIHGLRSLEYPWDDYILKYRKQNKKTFIKYIVYKIFPSYLLRRSSRKSHYDFLCLFHLTQNQEIVTISEHSKYSLFYFFPYLVSFQIRTFYSPYKRTDPIVSNESDVLLSYKIKHKNYILMICGDRSEKGAYRAIKTLVNLLSTENHIIPDDLKIVVTGVIYRKAYERLAYNFKNFIFLDYIPAEHLEIFYKNAHLFLYPTMNEGFGYPPLEAMKYGTICACSANSALTEVCSDAVLYFNPFDETELNIRILQSFDRNIREGKIEKMRVRYEQIREKQNRDLDALVNLIASSS